MQKMKYDKIKGKKKKKNFSKATQAQALRNQKIVPQFLSIVHVDHVWHRFQQIIVICNEHFQSLTAVDLRTETQKPDLPGPFLQSVQNLMQNKNYLLQPRQESYQIINRRIMPHLNVSPSMTKDVFSCVFTTHIATPCANNVTFQR